MKNDVTLTVRFWLEGDQGLRIEARWMNQPEVLEVTRLNELAEYLLAFDQGFHGTDPSDDETDLPATRALH
ncbi:MAG: hypothetical protein HC933_04735 [Pleurocapsa sp. SU_196_0]|nr:hypothetical protein [Pleurocapsa sp. SU_196_0]